MLASNRHSVEKKVNNVGDPINVSTVEAVGACSHRTAITVNSTPQEITIGAGKRSIEIFNADTTNDIYIGGSGVASTSGRPIYAGTGERFMNVKMDFSIYLVCAAGLTANVRLVEYT